MFLNIYLTIYLLKYIHINLFLSIIWHAVILNLFSVWYNIVWSFALIFTLFWLYWMMVASPLCINCLSNKKEVKCKLPGMEKSFPHTECIDLALFHYLTLSHTSHMKHAPVVHVLRWDVLNRMFENYKCFFCFFSC